MAKKLNLSSTKDYSRGDKTSVLLYGSIGAGKTTWASTWPNPVFLVPKTAKPEMDALKHLDPPLHVVGFGTLNEMIEQIKALSAAINKGELLCDTLIIDNLTAIQLMLQDDLKKMTGKDNLEFDEWNIYNQTLQDMMFNLHDLPPHIIWIAHSDTVIAGDKVYGDIFMSGKAAKKVFKAFPSMVLEAACKDLKGAGKTYHINLRSHGIWECKIRADGDKVAAFPASIPAHYDELAALMGWPTCEEIEEGGSTTAKKKAKRK